MCFKLSIDLYIYIYIYVGAENKTKKQRIQLEWATKCFCHSYIHVVAQLGGRTPRPLVHSHSSAKFVGLGLHHSVVIFLWRNSAYQLPA